MPLASLFNLQFYGPASGSARISASSSVAAGIKGQARAGATINGSGAIISADGTRLVNSPATITGTGAIIAAGPKARARLSATIRVNQLSQDDVTGAVLEAQVEPGLTLRQALLDARKAAKLAAALSA